LTASTVSSGSLIVFNSAFNINFTSSSTGAMGFFFTDIDVATFNITAATFGGSGTSGLDNCLVGSGTAVAISIGASGIVAISNSTVSSSNTNAIDGAGTLTYNNVTFSSTSQKISTTTQSGGTLKGGLTQAPSAGFLGEQITNSATAVVLANNTPANITSITLTAGIWDISCLAQATQSGASTLFAAGISTNTGSFTGTTAGINTLTLTITIVSGVYSVSVPTFRVTITSSTTYYLVAQASFSGGANSTNGRITGTRVA